MHLVMDAIVLAVLGVSLALGWRRGFVKSVSGLVGLVLALVLASTLAQPVGEKIDEAVIRPWAIDQVVSMQGDAVTADTPIEQLDIVAVNAHISQIFHVDILGTADASGQTVGEYVESMVVDSGITMSISRSLATILLFVGTSLVVWLITLILTPILKLPGLKQFNEWLGLLVGLLNAVIILLVVATVVRLFGSSIVGFDFGPQEIEQTFLFKYIDQMNPIVNWIIK